MKSENKVILYNAISSLILQLITIISGFIIPKLILNTFGSEVNGLISSLNQFLNYVAILEGGVTGVIMANLYKPLYDDNESKVNSIINTASNFYKKISYIFILYSVVVAFVYPLITRTSFSYVYIFSLAIILSFNLFFQYCFSLSLKCLLNADRKVYYTSMVQTLTLIINIIVSIFVIKLFPSIHVLKLLTTAIFLIQPILYSKYIKKHYNINKNENEDKNLIKSRWDGFSINIAYFVHANTDITLLSLITNLKYVSIYSVYALVITGIRQIILSISNGISPSIGRLYAKGNQNELNTKFSIYEHIIFSLVFCLFTIGGLLITPFVLLYTKNITDANYNRELFGYLILIAEGIYVLRSPYVELAYSANKFKDIKIHAYIEAILNIIISLTLVKNFSLLGVAIGTLVSMLYRTIYQVVYLKNNILNRNVSVFIKKIFIYIITYTAAIIICRKIYVVKLLSISSWLIGAIIYTIIIGFITMLISVIFYKKETKKIILYLTKNKNRKDNYEKRKYNKRTSKCRT